MQIVNVLRMNLLTPLAYFLKWNHYLQWLIHLFPPDVDQLSFGLDYSYFIRIRVWVCWTFYFTSTFCKMSHGYPCITHLDYMTVMVHVQRRHSGFYLGEVQKFTFSLGERKGQIKLFFARNAYFFIQCQLF